MSTKLEYTGKDVAEAIKKACSQLNVSQDQLTIEIQSVGSQGIFGLCRRQAKILVSLRSETEPDQPAAAEVSRKPATETAPGANDSHDLSALTTDINTDLSRLLLLMGLPAQLDIHGENNKIIVRISGENAEEIIGQDGQTLDNLQYLLRKMISRKHPEKVTISLDAGNYREGRSKDLEELARQLAREVRENGKTRSIPALNPAERRIVHMILQEDTTIRSRSVGEGLFKKILIYLPGKNKKKNGRTEKNDKVAL
jgi:spoIIIJ-associated protein